MAVAKRRTTTRRRTPAKKTTTVRRRRTPAKKKGFLSEFVTAAEAKGAFRATMSGAIGAVPAIAIEKIAANQNPTNQGLIMMATGFGIAALAKAPNAGAGCAAVGVYKIIQETGMLDEGGAEFADPLQNLPMYLSEDEMMYLQENGAEEMYLQDGYGVGYYQQDQGFGY